MYHYRNKNRGYSGYSMSNRAVEAYARGEKPISRWTKSEIIEEIQYIDPDKAEMLKKVNAKIIKREFLSYEGYHHTSKYCNVTSFYSFNEEAVADVTEEKVKEWIEEGKKPDCREL